MHRTVMATPFGSLSLAERQGCLVSACFSDENAENRLPGSRVLRSAVVALQCFFETGDLPADIKLAAQGTDFQQKVWEALRHIEIGQTRTYGDVARELATSPRAVGQACRRNPIVIFTPCHRVVAESGTGGFAGERAGRLPEIKQQLLVHEHQFRYSA